MSSSVWYEEVDTAFLHFIQDKLGASIEGFTAKVRKPEEDFKVEEYPSVTIYPLYESFNHYRRDPNDNKVIVSKNAETNSMEVRSQPKPYELFYQVDFWTELKSHMNTLTRLWEGQVPRYFNLPCKDTEGNETSVLVFTQEELKHNDFLNGTKRIFHSFKSYRVSVYLNETPIETLPMTTSIESSVNN